MIAPARQIAFRILNQMTNADAHSDELLRSPEVDRLSAVDRNLTTTLVMGTLRWQLALDARIRRHLARPDTRLSVEVATALQMGAYQLLHLERVPAYAVIHDSVELVKQGKERSAAGMINAVLRKIQATGPMPQATKDHSAAGSAAISAHPAWMVERWVRQYGEDAAEAICRWDQEPAGTTLRMDPGVDLSRLDTEPGFFLSCARRLVSGDAPRSHVPGEGAVRIQDEASQLVAEIAAAAVEGGRNVLDTCAAPGRKTAILAERLPEAAITAVDVSRKRLEGMRRILPESVAGKLTFKAADAAAMDLEPEWDLILCDVPCSGTGTMARNPEIRFRLTEPSLKRRQVRQAAILQAGLQGLRSNGRLVYSTCSLEPEENEQVVEEVLREAPEFRIVPVAGILDRLQERGIVTAEGRERLRSANAGDFLRTVPGVHPCDGFFAAVVERIPAAGRQ